MWWKGNILTQLLGFLSYLSFFKSNQTYFQQNQQTYHELHNQELL